MKKVKIGNRLVGEGCPVFIVAEIGVNHNGSLSRAKAMIEAAISSGADAVKFQTFRADDFLRRDKEYYSYRSRGKYIRESMFRMFKRLELPWEWHRILFNEVRKRHRIAFSTPMSPDAIDFLMTLNVPAFKVGSDDLTNYPLLEYMAGKKKPVILSTGMSTPREIEKAITTITRAGNSGIILLHCVSLYPAKPDEVNLKAMDFLRKRFGFPVGFSDHSEGIICSIAAVARGASVIERHFTLDKKLPGPDHYFSLDPEEMRFLADSIREVEKCIGPGFKGITRREERMRHLCRRSIVASSFIPAGAILREDMLSTKRPGTGLGPEFLKRVTGKIARRDIKKDELLEWDDIK